ncbi:MAG: hypothetical protein ACKOWD_01790 [Rhodoferax sp.]
MRTALGVGNGLAKSLTAHLELSMDTSNPLSWPVLSPGKTSLLIEDLPYLKEFIVKNSHFQDDFSIFRAMVDGVSVPSENPLPPIDNENAILDAGHYLAIAYSHFQLAVDSRNINEWVWMDWLKKKRI